MRCTHRRVANSRQHLVTLSSAIWSRFFAAIALDLPFFHRRPKRSTCARLNEQTPSRTHLRRRSRSSAWRGPLCQSTTVALVFCLRRALLEISAVAPPLATWRVSLESSQHLRLGSRIRSRSCARREAHLARIHRKWKLRRCDSQRTQHGRIVPEG